MAASADAVVVDQRFTPERVIEIAKAADLADIVQRADSFAALPNWQASRWAGRFALGSFGFPARCEIRKTGYEHLTDPTEVVGARYDPGHD